MASPALEVPSYEATLALHCRGSCSKTGSTAIPARVAPASVATIVP